MAPRAEILDAQSTMEAMYPYAAKLTQKLWAAAQELGLVQELGLAQELGEAKELGVVQQELGVAQQELGVAQHEIGAAPELGAAKEFELRQRSHGEERHCPRRCCGMPCRRQERREATARARLGA